MSGVGPRLTTWALHQVVSFLGYNGRTANVGASAESDPKLPFVQASGCLNHNQPRRPAASSSAMTGSRNDTERRALYCLRPDNGERRAGDPIRRRLVKGGCREIKPG
jgi:hypothetical protein